MNDDERLKEGFAKLRKADERRVPPFDPMWRAPVKKRSPWVVVVPMGGALAAAAAVFLFIGTQRDAPQSTASAPVVAAAPVAAPAVIAQSTLSVPRLDRAPLDFLLDVPGLASLTTSPNFDRSILQERR